MDVLTTPNSPIVYLESPSAGAVVSGMVTVEGWALSASTSNGAAVGGVQILVDGTVVANVVTGVARGDVCAVNPDRAACPNVGFSYQLNTSNLKSGPHILSVQATDSGGNPLSGSWRTTINVASQ